MRSGWQTSSPPPTSATCVCWWIAPTERPARLLPWYFANAGSPPTSCTSSPMAATSMPDAVRSIPNTLRKLLPRRNGKYDLGITFDGDADRALFSDASGRVVNGDAVLLLAARDMKTHVALASRHSGGDHHVEHGTGGSARRSGFACYALPWATNTCWSRC